MTSKKVTVTFATPKKISQETFDNVVKENMDEFEMSIEEAIEDAIKQFESQGVDLSAILTKQQVSLNGSGTSVIVRIVSSICIDLFRNNEKFLT
jgi:hypothetical protein